jgi:F-type H+-transporting ATPase subunit delta
MDVKSTVLSRKYADAFLNLYMDSVTDEMITQLEELSAYLKSHKSSLVFFGLHHIAVEEKLRLFETIVEHTKPSIFTRNLFRLLIRHNRVVLCPHIIDMICTLYRKRKNIMMFDVQTSHSLGTRDIECIRTFLNKKTNKRTVCTQRINQKLIAGIRLQSETLLWEYSINKQLKTLAQLIAIKAYQ